ncbi:hypothetical protein [Aureimonas psammosilenae]|uniref:hypothetical protein n=1 Tax=Aureimonas psammosilenae TaxID=2495496 RepID=UPI00126136D6|nr:hypothetical protein [Aureimonas psammosilenae]
MIENEPLRRRLAELHDIYLVPAPNDHLARRVDAPEFVFLPGVSPRISTSVETIVKPNRGKRHARTHRIVVDSDRVAAAVAAIGTDVVMNLIVVDAEIVGNLDLVPIWKVVGIDGGMKGNQLPKLREAWVSRASDGMFVFAPTRDGMRTCLQRYWKADAPEDWQRVRFHGVSGSDHIVTAANAVRRHDLGRSRKADPKRDCFWISGHSRCQIEVGEMLHGRWTTRFVERVRPFFELVWKADDGVLVRVRKGGLPAPERYAEWKASEARRIAEEVRQAELDARTREDDEDDAALANVFM